MEGPCVKVYYGNLTMLPDAARVLACLHEKDVKFQLQEMDKGRNLPQEFFRLQASTRVPGPAFDDGTRVLFESRPICRYVSEKYLSRGNRYLLGRDMLERSAIEQWVKSEECSFDPPSWTLVFHLAFAPCLHMEPDLVQIQESESKLNEVLDVYEQRLAESKYLAGNEFSLADLTHLPNSHYLANSKDWSYLITSRKHVRKWWKRISDRPSWKEASRILDNVHPKKKPRDDDHDTTITVSFHQHESPNSTLTSQQDVALDTVTLDYPPPSSSTQHPSPPSPDFSDEQSEPPSKPPPPSSSTQHPSPPSPDFSDEQSEPPSKPPPPPRTNMDGLFPGGKRKAPQPPLEPLLLPMEGDDTSPPSLETEALPPSTTQPADQPTSEAPKEEGLPFPASSKFHATKRDPEKVEPLLFESSPEETHAPSATSQTPPSQPRSLPSTTEPVSKSSSNSTTPIPNKLETPQPTAPPELSFPPTFDVNLPVEDLQGEPPSLDAPSTEYTNTIPSSAPSQMEKSSSPSTESEEDLGPYEPPPLLPTPQQGLTEIAPPVAPVPQEEPYVPPTSKDHYPSQATSKEEPQPVEPSLKPQAFDLPLPLPSLSHSTEETEDVSSPPTQLEPEKPQESPSSVSSKDQKTSFPSAESNDTAPSKPLPSSTAIPPEPLLLGTLPTEIPNNTEATQKEEDPPSFQPNSSQPSSPSIKPSSEESSQPSNSDGGAINSTSQFPFLSSKQNLDTSDPTSETFPPSNPQSDAATTPESETPPPKPSTKPIVPPDPESPSK